MTKQKTIAVYAAGGCGVNIGSIIEEQIKRKQASGDNTVFADIVIHYIDTSEANTKFRNLNENIYLFEGVDGSGSVRTRNKDVISDSVPDIIIKHPPGDLNIVINSTGGGSGSVIGPMIASHLLASDKLVICMATQTTGTIKQLTNTVSVLATYESIAKGRKKVLPLLLCDNSEESETNVNNTISNAVQMLAILFSGKLERLDSADLEHWINYNKVTTNPIGAVLLDIAYDASNFPRDFVVCSVATLVNNPDTATAFPRIVEYQAIGLINSSSENEFASKALHFALIDGPIQQAFETREKELEEATNITASRKARKSIADNDKFKNKEGDFVFD